MIEYLLINSKNPLRGFFFSAGVLVPLSVFVRSMVYNDEVSI